MVGRSNEISREICRVQDADDEPLPLAARDTARPMAQARRWRMRENRTYDSEGGAAETNRPLLPLSSVACPRIILFE